jgi:hypothetical protein
MGTVNRAEIVILMERRLENVRKEEIQASQHVDKSSPSHLQSVANELLRLAGAEQELVILLRASAGMNPNGRWPHPAGTCIQCGRQLQKQHDTGHKTCILCRRKESR